MIGKLPATRTGQVLGRARKTIAKKRFGVIAANLTFRAIAARITMRLVSVYVSTAKLETWKATKCNTVGIGEMRKCLMGSRGLRFDPKNEVGKRYAATCQDCGWVGPFTSQSEARKT